MALLMMAYLILCLPVRASVFAAADGLKGCAHVCVTCGALSFRVDGVGMLLPGKGTISPRYAKKQRHKAAASDMAGRVKVFWAMLDALGDGLRGKLRIYVRIGGSDAAAIALMTGAARAVVSAVSGMAGKRFVRDIVIVPDVGGEKILAAAHCIAAAQLGDIMFAAGLAAAKNRKIGEIWRNGAKRLRMHREGTEWISIPSRA